jgi:hypothetical protein
LVVVVMVMSKQTVQLPIQTTEETDEYDRVVVYSTVFEQSTDGIGEENKVTDYYMMLQDIDFQYEKHL